MKRSHTIQAVFHTLGSLITIQGCILLLPMVVVLLYHEYSMVYVFILSSFLSLVTGISMQRFTRPDSVRFLQGMLICGLAWIVLSLFGALPFYLGSNASFLDAYFETVSGYTTTGITIFTNIESLPRSILFWRSLIQWLGGLGILTFFLAITFRSHSTYFQLFSAESHKIDSTRPTPSISKTIIILWTLYTIFTLVEVIALKILGLNLFDSLCHSLTSLSTGGFSPYDSSVDYFRRTGYAHYKAIEYVITFFMFLGGMNFLLHYKLIKGRFNDVSNNTELRYYVTIILFSTLFVIFDRYHHILSFSLDKLEDCFRHTIFTVVSLVTTTGFGTTDINDPFFPPMSKQIFLILMLVGGCVGSTGGGVKVLRIAILFKAFRGQITKLRLPRKALSEVVVDHQLVPDAELKRIAGIFFGWLLLLLIGGLATDFFSDLGSWESFSGMFSAVGNIGPCYISVQQMSELPGIVKLTYIFGMLAGRLEIFPILLLFSTKAWR